MNRCSSTCCLPVSPRDSSISPVIGHFLTSDHCDFCFYVGRVTLSPATSQKPYDPQTLSTAPILDPGLFEPLPWGYGPESHFVFSTLKCLIGFGTKSAKILKKTDGSELIPSFTYKPSSIRHMNPCRV